MIVDMYSPLAAHSYQEVFGNESVDNEEDFFSNHQTLRSLLADRLVPCHCGGKFSVKALHRCPVCNAEIAMDEIKRQINWWGWRGGRPGVIMRDSMNEAGETRSPENDRSSLLQVSNPYIRIRDLKKQ
jgi:hypothetical protein